MAEGLAEAGASLMLCARREEWLTPTVERFRKLGHRVEGLVADVSKPADVQAVVDMAMKAYGEIDMKSVESLRSTLRTRSDRNTTPPFSREMKTGSRPA